MKHLKTLFVIFVILALFFSCSASKKTLKKPPVKFNGTILSKYIYKKEFISVPKEPATTFGIQDQKVVAHLNIENLSGEHNIRWDWYDPNGNLYYSSGDFPIKTSQGKYLKQVTTWHALTLKGDKAANIPGQWKVKIFIANELADTKTFTLDDVLLPEGITQRPFPPNPNDWGLIIGIEEYANLPNVEFARKDALIVKDYFKMFRVPQKNIITLIDSDATKARLEGYLEQYLSANVQEDTTLYVYFAGHGAPDMEKGEPYLVPHDGDTRFIEQTGYKLIKFYNDLDNLNIKRSFVFLDSCFSGVASRASEMLTKGTRPALIHVKDVVLKEQKIVSLSSSSAGQTSNTYPATEHGLFTYYLLKGFRGDADANDDYWIGTKELFDYVSMHVPRAARRLGSEQTPAIMPSLKQIIDIPISMAIGKVPR